MFRSTNKLRYKITNWEQYNQVLLNSGALIFWVGEEIIPLWNQTKQSNYGRPRLFSELAITMALMVKRAFSILSRSLQGFINSVFKPAQPPWPCPTVHALASELNRLTSRSRRRIKEPFNV
ncbi:transposase [Candidatus Enterovibrio altilux]|uniref:transposase n=1 Tax=Candidatus Enterovibrio altilux TaxID=1927128 RepID=UPI00374482DD